jgi:hypothetical protein
MFHDVTAPNSPEIYKYKKRFSATVPIVDINENTQQTYAE